MKLTFLFFSVRHYVAYIIDHMNNSEFFDKI